MLLTCGSVFPSSSGHGRGARHATRYTLPKRPYWTSMFGVIYTYPRAHRPFWTAVVEPCRLRDVDTLASKPVSEPGSGVSEKAVPKYRPRNWSNSQLTYLKVFLFVTLFRLDYNIATKKIAKDGFANLLCVRRACRKQK